MADDHPVSKVSEFTELANIADEDLLYVSEDDGAGDYVSKHVKHGTIVGQNDLRYLKRVDVNLNLNLPALIITK